MLATVNVFSLGLVTTNSTSNSAWFVTVLTSLSVTEPSSISACSSDSLSRLA